MENENIVPSTRSGQIAREVHSISLARAAGIACPVMIFSLEMAVFMGQLSRWNQEDPAVHGRRFAEECRQLDGG